MKKIVPKKSPIYKKYLDIDFYDDILTPHQKKIGVNNSNKILRILTIELHLNSLRSSFEKFY